MVPVVDLEPTSDHDPGHNGNTSKDLDEDDSFFYPHARSYSIIKRRSNRYKEISSGSRLDKNEKDKKSKYQEFLYVEVPPVQKRHEYIHIIPRQVSVEGILQKHQTGSGYVQYKVLLSNGKERMMSPTDSEIDNDMMEEFENAILKELSENGLTHKHLARLRLTRIRANTTIIDNPLFLQHLSETSPQDESIVDGSASTEKGIKGLKPHVVKRDNVRKRKLFTDKLLETSPKNNSFEKVTSVTSNSKNSTSDRRRSSSHQVDKTKNDFTSETDSKQVVISSSEIQHSHVGKDGFVGTFPRAPDPSFIATTSSKIEGPLFECELCHTIHRRLECPALYSYEDMQILTKAFRTMTLPNRSPAMKALKERAEQLVDIRLEELKAIVARKNSRKVSGRIAITKGNGRKNQIKQSLALVKKRNKVDVDDHLKSDVNLIVTPPTRSTTSNTASLKTTSTLNQACSIGTIFDEHENGHDSLADKRKTTETDVQVGKSPDHGIPWFKEIPSKEQVKRNGVSSQCSSDGTESVQLETHIKEKESSEKESSEGNLNSNKKKEDMTLTVSYRKRDIGKNSNDIGIPSGEECDLCKGLYHTTKQCPLLSDFSKVVKLMTQIQSQRSNLHNPELNPMADINPMDIVRMGMQHQKEIMVGKVTPPKKKLADSNTKSGSRSESPIEMIGSKEALESAREQKVNGIASELFGELCNIGKKTDHC